MNQESNDLVSVIIPVYNGEHYIEQAIYSVINQTYKFLEIILIDDGSTDRSKNIIKSIQTEQVSRKINYFYQKNQGVAIARNQGISHSKGEYIAFLDQDDIWMPNKLSLQIKFLKDNPNIDFVLGKQKIFLEEGIPQPKWLRPQYLTEEITAYLLGVLLTRKSIFRKIGCFDQTYKYGNDYDWFLKAIDKKLPYHILDEVILLKRIHDCNESYNIDGMTLDMLRYLRQSVYRKRQIQNSELKS